jgi:Replication initiator protein A
MEPAPRTKPTVEPDIPSAPRHSHDEQNLAEFPFVLLSKRPPKGMHTVEYQDYDQHPRTGAAVLRKVIITASGKYLLPTIGDEEVLMALIYLTLVDKNANGFDDPTVWFSRRQLLQILGWPDTGPYYSRLKKSMRRWKTVNIIYENWWDPVAKEFIPDLAFNIIDNYKFFDGRRTEPPQLALPLDDAPAQRSQCYVKWNETIFNSFKNGSLTKLDLDMFFSLPTAAAKRAYRYLNVRLPQDGQQSFDLKTFACQHIGFSPNYKPSRLRSEVQQAIVEPLEKNDFIEPLSQQRRFHKRNGRDCIAFARKAPTALPSTLADQAASPPLEALDVANASHLIHELTCRGLGGKLAAQFVAKHSVEYLEQKIEYFDFELNAGTLKKPVAYLRKAIEDDYGIPAGFVSVNERQRQQEAKQARERQAVEERRRKQQQEADEKAESKAVSDHWESLTPEQQAELDAASIAAADPATLANENGPFKASLQRFRREGYIRQLLRNRQMEPA